MMLSEGIAPDRVALIICEDYAIRYGAASDITNHAARALREPPAPTLADTPSEPEA
jgi:hypothetical protein